MELNVYFTGMILLYCTVHLAMELGKQIITRFGRDAHGDRAHSDMDSSRRDDWYVFFHCRDLTGETLSSRTAGEQRPDAGRPVRPAQPAGNRPSRRARV